MPSVVLPPLTLVLGDEELLAGRAVAEVVAAVRAMDAQADIRELAGGDLDLGDLLDLLSPSLFGERRVVVMRSAQDLTKEVQTAVLSYAADPAEEVVLVVVHAGGAKAKGFADALPGLGARVVACPRVTKPADRLAFVRTELQRSGRPHSEGALRLLVDAVGADLRELAGAVDQLVADTSGLLDETVVARYYSGRADLKGFDVADRAIEGDAAAALELLRHGLAVGLAPVLVTSALASGLRAVAQVASAGRASGPALAKQLGMPPWKVDRVRRQMRGWHPDGLAAALQACAVADMQVKGAGADSAYALHKVVLAVVAARQGRSKPG